MTEIAEKDMDKFLVWTRSQTKSSGIRVPVVHGADKGLIPHVKPEHQKSVVAPTTHPIPPIHHTRPMHQTQSYRFKDHLQALSPPYPSPE